MPANITFKPSIILGDRWSSSDQPGSSPSGGWRANEPAGVTSGAWSERIFGSQTDGVWWSAGSTPMTIADTDSEWDDGNGKAGRVVFPVGHAGGDDAPSATGYSWDGSRSVYLCFDFLLSEDWQPHPTGTNKIFYLTNSGGNPAFLSWESDQEVPQIQIRNQAMAVYKDTKPNLATVEYQPGQRVLVECLLTSNTASGVADGEAHLWIDGVKTTEYTDLEWNDTNFTFNQVLWNPIWGGGGGEVEEEMYQEISQAWLSYKS